MLEFGAENVSVTDADGTELVVGQLKWNQKERYATIQDARVLDQDHHCHASIREGLVERGHNQYRISVQHAKIHSTKMTLERRVSHFITMIMNETLVTVVRALISILWPQGDSPMIHLLPAEIDAKLAMDSMWMPNMDTKVEIPGASLDGWSGLAEHLSAYFRSEYIRSVVLP